ncbi:MULTISPECIES: glycosyltransferase [unclassified Sphingomonas]|uniref:glycosyltransferase n=1 Tax=unclassified Sphingomonas TaxID=196159 RepID=UPI00092C10B9|nr:MULTISPECIES: glycosyltransferase [unclassified Sphingomonas]MBN8849631.1 glycosyltransferase [Sphingomonas sp.]OJV27705.1 MAG: hypothetical protein BGO24_06340 [Sphingomonas sp. 67-36]
MADPSTPILSLIVPVYGVEDYVADCLDSIFGAPGFSENCELVIVDDGSLDGSMAIVEQRCADVTNVTIVHQANGGLGAARNTGLAHARGRYIWFVDSDDEICRDAICALMRCMERFASDVIAFEFETLGGILDRAPYLAVYNRPVKPADFLLSGRVPSGTPFYAFSRTLLEQQNLRFVPGIYHEDALFTPLAIAAAETLVRLRETCYRYRLRGGSIMAVSDPAQHARDMVRVIQGLHDASLRQDRASPLRAALAQEIGFAFSALRHYMARVPRRDRASIVPLGALLSGAWPFIARFRKRSLINFARLVLLRVEGALP